MGFELVIFDNDGVLVDSEGHANRILSELLGECGRPMSRDDCVATFMGTSMAYVREIIEAELGTALPGDFEDRYHTRLFDVLRRELRPMPGVIEALDRLDAATCVASSGTHERIRLALTTTRLIDRFAGRIFSAQDVARGKPAPDLFLHAAAQLGVEPARCAVIEDSPLGIEAANAAGMTAFGFAAFTPAARLRHARGGVFTTMADLPTLLATSR
jgi:HAD superfamily hydrolase (TIGR01509 family)